MYKNRIVEEVNCNLCGQNRTEFLFKKEDYNIVRCLNCSLIYVNPRDKQEDIRQRYLEPYFHIKDFQKKDPKIVGYFDYIGDRSVYEDYFEKKIKQIEKIYPQKGKILDIGCGLGYFLNRAKKYGWQTYGTEISKFASDYAQKNFGHRVIQGQLEKKTFPKEYFNVVTLFQIVEHLPDPSIELRKIYYFLKKDGLLLITTPNAGSLIARLMGKRWFAYRPKEHFYNFSPKTIRAMLEKAGFKKTIIKRDNYVAYPFERILERIVYNYRSKFTLNLVKFFDKVLKFLRLSKLKIRIPVGDIMVITGKGKNASN